MAISVSIIKRSGVAAAGRAVIADVTFDSAYPAGGEPYTAADFGLNTVDFLHTESAKASSTQSYTCLADHANKKLMLFQGAGAINLPHLETATANQSATVVRVLAFELPHL